MRMLYLLCTFLLLYTFTSNALSQESLFCGDANTVVVHGNGVNTTQAAAVHNLIQIQSRLQSNLSNDEFDKLEFALAYNRTNGFIRDLFESAQQDIQTNSTQFWRFLVGLDILPDSLQQKFLEIVESIDVDALVNNTDLQNHVTFYKSQILEGKKVVLVSHSQGNFFANLAYPNLNSEEQQSFGIVSVANPDSFVAGNGPYTTLFEDLVILALIALSGVDPLPPTTTNGFTSDLLGHNFVKAYLEDGSRSESRIIGHILDVINTLENPSGDAEDGIITVTLTWGAEPDVDLHAFEPNGAHIFYRNLVGPSGFLDVDDIDGFGPEHYFVSCETLETGTYGIAVNYFTGDGVETATIQIEAGLLVQTFTQILTTAVGSSGDNNPIPIANIIVSGNDEDGFAFEIQ